MNELLASLSEQGIELWTDGEQLHYRGPRQALTPSVLAEIKAKKGALLDHLKGGYVARTYPLSHPQRALWYLYQSAPESHAYNTAMAARLRFDPDPDALRAALQTLLVRHPCLRTSFIAADGVNGLEPAQQVHAYREVLFERIDASSWSPEELRERVRVAHQRPFDLEKGPVLRASLFDRGVRDHVLLISIHHIVCDGWSMWLLMDELWKAYAAPGSVSTSTPAPVELPELAPSLSDALCEALRGRPTPTADADDGNGEMERFVQEGLAGVIDTMGAWDAGPCSKDALRARLKVLPKYTRLFEALLDILEQGKAVAISSDGVVQRVGASREGPSSSSADTLREHGERLKRSFPVLSAYVDLTRACLSALPEVLVGARNAMEVLFPGGSMDLVEKTYRGNAVADFNNERIASFTRAYVEERLRRDPAAVVRILEVGAGTGGTSVAVLEALGDLGARGQVKYLYTDVSPAFARHGERTFGERSAFAEFKTLDVERSPGEQGFEPGSVDVVIGSHVLHATRRMDASLRHVKSLLRKNGLLLLNETTRAQAFLTVTFGLMDGWWRFEDEAVRMKGSPLLDREQWRTALEARGFRAIQRISLREEGPGGGAPQVVIVAESDGVLEADPGERSTRSSGTYESFVRAQAAMLGGPEGERHWQYWQRQLSGSLPSLDVPLDRPRPAVQTYQGRWVPFRIPEDLAAGLRRFAGERGATLYAVLLAGYQMLLHRYSGQEDLVVGCPTAGRQDRAYDRIVGHFVNTVPVRADFTGNPSVEEVIARTRTALLGALEHQDLPFPVLVNRLNPKRDAGRPPIFQTMFVFQEPPKDLALAEVVTDFYSGNARTTIHGLDFESFPVSQQEGQFDLSAEVTGSGLSLKGVLKYNECLFEAASMERMSRHFTTLLRSMVEHPELPVSALPLLGDDETRQVLHGWNDTARAWPLECVHALVEAQARRTPDAAAVVFEGRSVSYGALNRQANQLGRLLRARGVAPGEPVGISMERSVEMLVGVLGILKAGGAYVPLDPHYPKDRVAFMLDDAAIRVLVTSEDLAGRLPVVPKETICLDRDWPTIEQESGADLGPRSTPSDLAYVLYTSGSTGRPKGVAMPHGPLCNLLRWQQETSSVGAGGRTLGFTTLNFDVSFQELFSTLMVGGTVVLVGEALRQDPEGLLRLMKAESVDRVFVPFVVLKLLAEAAQGSDALLPSSLREIITAGEALRVTPSIVDLLSRLDGCRLINQYGPTEAHVVTSHTLEGPPDRWPYLPPIGRPIANARIYIVDQRLHLVPPGVPGELLIGGACLATGYLRQPELTSKQFIADPFGGDGGRLYRTGDLARFLSDGTIEFLGRADHQVKINGFRIELAEIEKQLLAHPAVAEAVVVCDEDASGAKRLCAYFVRKAEVGAAGLKAHLAAKLPGYMVPAFFVELPAIPLTPNKKVDRQALPPPQASALAGTAHVAPRDEVEVSLVEICRSLLKLDRLGVEDNLFEVGVNSLTTLSIQRRIDQVYPGKITVPDLIRFPTIAGLATAIRGRDAVAPAPSKKAAQYNRFLEVLNGSK